jgi:hypothetical protein
LNLSNLNTETPDLLPQTYEVIHKIRIAQRDSASVSTCPSAVASVRRESKHVIWSPTRPPRPGLRKATGDPEP